MSNKKSPLEKEAWDRNLHPHRVIENALGKMARKRRKFYYEEEIK